MALEESFKKMGEVEVKPEFPGGIERFYKFVGSNFKNVNTEPAGTIRVRYIIETDGCLSSIEIVKNEVGVLSGQEFIRVLQKCPRWIPGYIDGTAVRVEGYIPLTVQGGL